MLQCRVKKIPSCTGSCGGWVSVSKRVFSCTKSCSLAEFGAQEGHFLHRKLWRVEFGVKKGIFLHHFLWREFGAKKSVFLHQKWSPGRVWCAGGAFSALEVVAGWFRCQKECFPAPKVVPWQSLVRRKGISCTGSCTINNLLQ